MDATSDEYLEEKEGAVYDGLPADSATD